MTSTLVAEVAAKQSELGGAPIDRAVESLLIDAATAWETLRPLGTVSASGATYPNRLFGCHQSDGFFERLVVAIENNSDSTVIAANLIRFAGAKARSLPTPAMARRLRVMTGDFPRLIRPVKKRGYGSRPYALWKLLWLDACGTTAPKIAAAIRPAFDEIGFCKLLTDIFEPRPSDAKIEGARQDHEKEFPLLKRDRIWKLRKAVYQSVSVQIETKLRASNGAVAA